MSEPHLMLEEVSRFRGNRLEAGDVLRVSRHLGSCAKCAALARRITEHPDLESMLFRYVDGDLDRESAAVVAAHLAECARCRDDVADARSERQAMRRRPSHFGWLIAAAAAAVVIASLALYKPAPPVRPGPLPHPPVVASTERPDWVALVRDARAVRRIDRPDSFAALQVGRDGLRSPASHQSSVVLTPANGVIETQLPSFRWPATRNASYVVRVFENEQEVAKSGSLHEASWAPPHPLRRGATFAWEVEVRNGGVTTLPAPPDPPAFFTVAGEKEMAEIAEARRMRPDDHLLIGLLYARSGMRERAEEELGAWVAAHPDDGAARELLASVRAW